MEVSQEQLKLMKHALGLDWQKKPYRNRYFDNKDNSEWCNLVNKGLACKGNERAEDSNIMFWLTKEGVEFVLGHKIRQSTYDDL
jgi:hypothetical protein